jgi:hypothetical protein
MRIRARHVAALAMVMGTLAGCDAILGIDKFQDVPCTSCGDTALPDTSPVPEAGMPEADVVEEDVGLLSDGGPESGEEVIPPPRLWARWPMPTAETIGDASPYTDAGAALRDPVTGLTWQRALLPASDYESARVACAKIGDGTWKVPTRIELATLIDAARDAAPAWNESFGLDAGGSLQLWTASRFVASNAGSDQHWWIDFTTGAVVRSAGATAAVRCVKLP